MAAAKSSATAADRIHSAGLTSLVIQSSIGVRTTRLVTSADVRPMLCRRFQTVAAARAVASADACSGVIPGLTRASAS
jgi:hypothetical protein